jgi:protein phosphatase
VGEATGNGTLRSGAILAKLSWGMRSDPGPTRDHNEDFAGAYAPTIPDDAWDRGPLFVVADGLGGHAAGEVASRTAVETVLESWRSGSPGDPAKSLRSAARAANTAVFDRSLTAGRGGMATTLTALTFAGRDVVIAHVGDSRAYLVRGDTCRQLTTDHSRVGEMLRMKLISPEQAANHPARSQLTRTVGNDAMVQIDIVRDTITAGDTFVLCSDGLWGEVATHEILAVARGLGTAPVATSVAAADALVGMAVEREAADNVTAVVVHVSSGLPIPAAPAKRRSPFRWGRG